MKNYETKILTAALLGIEKKIKNEIDDSWEIKGVASANSGIVKIFFQREID